MASNIRVVLEVDNKKYLDGIKSADRATKQFADSSERSLNKLDKTIDGVSQQFGRLKTVLAGAAFAAVGRSIFALADEIDDLSNATGLAAGRIVEFRNALEQSGGAPADAAAGIIKFTQALDTAAEGSITAQNQLIALGISMDKLRSQSDEQVMMGVLEELSKMEAGARRTALMVEYFGKSFRTVDPSQLLANLKATRGEGDKYADSIAKAAELNGKLEKAFANLRLALLSGFAPIIEQVSSFSDTLSTSREEMDKLIVVVKTLAIAIAGVFAIGGALILVRTLGTVGRGVGAIFTLISKYGPAFGGAATAAGGLATATNSIFRAAGPVLTALRGIVIIAGTVVTGVIAASQIFDNFGDIAVNAIGRVVEALGGLAGEMLNLPTDALAAFLNLLPGIDIKNAVGLGTPFKIAAEQAKKAREEAESLQKAIKARQQFAQEDPRRLDRPGGSQVPGIAPEPTTTGRDVDETARANAIRQIQDIGAALTANIAKRKEQLNVERQAIGLTEAEAEALKTANDVRQQVADTIDQLKEKRAGLSKEEQYLIPVINQQISALEARTDIEVNGVLAALRAKQERAAADRLEMQNLKELVDLENLRAQILGYSITEQEKFNQARAAGEFKNKTAEEVDQLQRQARARDSLISTLNIEKIARETNASLIELETSILGTQFNAVQKLEQLKLANPDAFARKTKEEIDALTAQATKIDEVTAKFREQAFARDLLQQGQDFASNIRDEMNMQLATSEAARRRIQTEIDGRNQLQAKIREINQSYGDETKLSEGLRAQRAKEIADATAGITKLQAAKAQAVADDQAMRDSFSFGWESAFSKYAEDALTAANQSRTYFETFTKGFEDAFVRFVATGKFSFKDLANSIIADFARIQAKKALVGLFGGGGGGGGSFLSTLGSFFGGFFADGGNPPVGKMSIVGERGPEAFIPRNAGTIVPLENMGGGSQQVSVTYNIQAVDASSFKSMVARDPQFLYAVTEQGRRSLPGRR